MQLESASSLHLHEVKRAQRKMERTRILLADDHLEMQAGINTLLKAAFKIVGTVSDGTALVEAALKLHPDVIVTDISMPKMNGIEAVRRIHRMLPDIKFIFLTMQNGDSYRREARRVGASGYVLKSAAREELSQAIRHAIEGTVLAP